MGSVATVVSERFEYRVPEAGDARAIFDRYAADRKVCRYVGWPRHETVADTKAFLDFSAAEWERWPAGPFLIVDGQSLELVGSTGLAFTSETKASTGYVIAERFWGQGIASEALQRMLELAHSFGVEQLLAICHPEHQPSRHVLEKAGFGLDAHRPETLFPNLDGGVTVPAVCYSCEPGTLLSAGH